MSENTEIAPIEDDRYALAMYDPDMDFRKLALDLTYVAKGFRLVPKDALIGVPHIIVAATYREGFPRAGTKGDYVSVEAVVADKDTLAAPQVRAQLPSELLVYPNEPVVYNDSGTGVRRTLTEFFHYNTLINVGKAPEGVNPFDKAFQKWETGSELAATGIYADRDGNKFRYGVPRGLRQSDYEIEGQPATTFYIG